MTTPAGLTDDKVLLAAAEEFAECGYAAATTRRIAERCGMSTGSLFHRYSSKRALLVAAVAEGTLQAYSHVSSRLQGHIDPLERFRVLVVAHLETLHGESRPFSAVASREFHLLDQKERTQVVRIRDQYEKLWQSILDEAAEAGLVSDDGLLRLFLLGAVNQTFVWYAPNTGLTIEELGERFVGLLLGGGSLQVAGGLDIKLQFDHRASTSSQK